MISFYVRKLVIDRLIVNRKELNRIKCDVYIFFPHTLRNPYSPGDSIGLKFIPSQSELFRLIPISVSEPMRIIPNQFEKRFVSRLMRNGQRSIRMNSINSETSIRKNPNQYETMFSIQINPISD